MKSQIIEWNDIPYVLAVCKTGSLSAAARELEVNHSTVFRRIERIEEKLGVRLFDRLSNGYAMTVAGEFFYNHAMTLHHGVNDIERELSGKDSRLEGTLTVTTTDSIAHCLAPAFTTFQQTYPEINLRIIADSRQLDLMQREADIAIRPTVNPPEHWLGKCVSTVGFAPYAHKDYFQALSNNTLDSQRWICLDQDLRHSPMSKVCDATIPLDSKVTVTNSLMSAYDLVLAKMGITVLPCYLGDQNEHLVQLNQIDPSFNWDIWLLSHPDLRRSARVHVFFRFAAEHIATALSGKV